MFYKKEFESCLAGIIFPAGKLDIINRATVNGAYPRMLRFMSNLSEKTYHSLEEVFRELSPFYAK